MASEPPLPEERAQHASRRGHPGRLPSRRPSASSGSGDAGWAGPSGSGFCFTVDDCWLDGWHGPTAIVADAGGFRLASDSDPTASAHLAGTILPGFRDAHVHLGLIDGAALLGGGIAVAHDFGWGLESARTWPTVTALPEVRIAGQLLTAPGGYPTASGWAPPDASREVAIPDDAPTAVDEQIDAGATFIKVALNSDAGPVFEDATLAAIVGHAHERHVAVAAHAQGAGQAARAFSAGVDLLAHAPWSERLPDDLIAAMAKAMSWVSTLDIHGWGRFSEDFAVANDNVRRFHAAGGRIRYGTDLGNGPLPVGVNERELLALEHAGLELDALAAAIAPAPAPGTLGQRISRITHPQQDDPAHWLATARLIDHDNLEEHLT
ncbi:MAG TPA: amidohydrolase [Terrimesophilobacter sp.]|nr:amidohydrolase [Terrimesophilobacter sp.]